MAAVVGIMRHRPVEPGVALADTPHRQIAVGLARTAPKFVNPVCGRAVDPANSRHVEEYQGTPYYFCCDGCWNSFRDNPAKYASIHLENRRVS
jgi:xanthine dehydrogenase accessory factor